MPLRTRDFLLFLTVVAFLLIAIVTTASRNSSNDMEGLILGFPLVQTEDNYDATVPETDTFSREKHLSDLRDKIARLGSEQSIASKLPDEEDDTQITLQDDEDSETEGDNNEIGKIEYCSNYRQINPAWDASGLEFEIIEGARIVYRNVNSQNTTSPESTAGVTTAGEREIVLQLPLRTQPVAIKNCIPTDVVGIALDGSLIRNNEHGVYSIFGSNTLVGYALDGFPIYGNNTNTKTDDCGGKTVAGGYRYYLSSEREGVLGCYAGVPVNL